MEKKATSRILLTTLLMAMPILAFNMQVERAHAPSSTPYTDFHDLLNAGSSNLQAIIGLAYEPFSQPGLWLSLGELNPYFVDPWYDNNNFVPANGRLLISVQDPSPLTEQVLTVEFDTSSLTEIYVPSTSGITDWLYLWVADDGSTYYDREMTLLARAPPVITANVDVKPDTLELGSKGNTIKAYIELPPGYAVSDIEVSKVELNSEVEALLHPTKIGDYDEDSIPDLMVSFNRAEVMALVEIGETTLTVTGEVNGIPFEGSDTITIIDQKPNHPPPYPFLRLS